MDKEKRKSIYTMPLETASLLWLGSFLQGLYRGPVQGLYIRHSVMCKSFNQLGVHHLFGNLNRSVVWNERYTGNWWKTLRKFKPPITFVMILGIFRNDSTDSIKFRTLYDDKIFRRTVRYRKETFLKTSSKKLYYQCCNVKEIQVLSYLAFVSSIVYTWSF